MFRRALCGLRYEPGRDATPPALQSPDSCRTFAARRASVPLAPFDFDTGEPESDKGHPRLCTRRSALQSPERPLKTSV